MPQLPSFPMQAPPPGGPQLGAEMPMTPSAPEPQAPAGPEQQGPMPLRGRPPVGGLNPDFAHRFVQLQNAVREAGGDLYIFSGARDQDRQGKLFQEAVAKYGDPKVAAKHVKPPGKSAHDPQYGATRGLGPGSVGVDIRGDLAIAHKLAPQFGIEFPNQSHPWHMEMAGVSKLKG
jgi:hypothetical protein